MKFIPAAFLSVVVTLLSACGGGSSQPTTTPNQGGTVTPTVPVSTINNNPPPKPTYAAGSDAEVMFNRLNHDRVHCGFGSLAQNALLDTMAQNHANYNSVNGVTHYETAGKQFYTGYSPQDRANYVGYTGSVGEVVAAQWYQSVTPNTPLVDTLLSTRLLLAAPYHMRSMLDGWTEMGVGSARVSTAIFINSQPGAMIFHVVGMNFGPSRYIQHQTNNEVLTYPCQDLTDVQTNIAGESPSPFGIDALFPKPIGQPIYFRVNDAQILNISTYSVTEVTTGKAVPVSLLTWQNDFNHYIYASETFIVPDVLLPSTQYRVVVTGDASGTAFKKDFTFTTAAI